MQKESVPKIIFENLGIHRENAVPFGTGSCRKFKPEWRPYKGNQICYHLLFVARARESSTKKVSQVKFSFSMFNEVMIQPD